MGTSRLFSHGLAALAAATAMTMMCGTAPAEAAPAAGSVPVQSAAAVPLPPELDPGFYRPAPDLVAAREPGELIAARQVNVATLGLVPLNVDAWQLSFRSNNSRDEPIAAVATVLKPRGSAPDKVLALQGAEDSLAGYCAPSYALQQWSVAALAGQIVVPAEFIIAQGALAQGWGMVIPDHQGPDEAFAAGPLAGRITLDSIRAARNFGQMRITADARIAMFGYSGGAIATGHAAELKQTYAPELNIVGAAEGGVPADLGAIVDVGNNQLWSGMIMSAILGLGREYPEFGDLLDRDLDPLGQGLAQVKNKLCVQYNTMIFPFLNMKGMLRVPGDPMQHPVVRDVVDKTRMGKSVPDMPMFIWQANPDELIPVGPVNTLVDTYCQSPDAQVRYTREHLGEHITTQLSGVATAMLWVRDRLDGVPAEAGCSTRDDRLMALDPEGLGLLASTFGEVFAGLLGKQLGAR